jgi:GxxExxY protein
VNDRDQGTFAILGAAIEVHRTWGHGFLEAVYSQALAFEMVLRGIDFRKEFRIPVFHKDVKLDCGYCADFLCCGAILVELKAQAGLTNVSVPSASFCGF